MPHFVLETGYNIGFRLNRVNPEGDWYWDYYSTHGLVFGAGLVGTIKSFFAVLETIAGKSWLVMAARLIVVRLGDPQPRRT